MKIIVDVMTRPVMKLEHPEDLSFFYECRTFLYKKILNGYVRVLDLSSFLPPLLNNVGLKPPSILRTIRATLRSPITGKIWRFMAFESNFSYLYSNIASDPVKTPRGT